MARRALGPDHQILSDGYLSKQVERLECPSYARLDPPINRPLRDSLLIEADDPRVWFDEASYGVDECGLSGTVWADQPYDFTSLYTDRYVCQGDDPTQLDGET